MVGRAERRHLLGPGVTAESHRAPQPQRVSGVRKRLESPATATPWAPSLRVKKRQFG